MTEKKNRIIRLTRPPVVLASAGLVGKKEGEGPLGDCFDEIVPDATFGKESWEQAESEMLRRTIELSLTKAQRLPATTDVIFAGDLQNQCTASSFAAQTFSLPFCGLFGACSTMALALCMAAIGLDSGAFSTAVAATSSHFCTAERQFRHPLEYGGQRPPSAQWTVTGAGAAVLGRANAQPGGVQISAVQLGTICDLGVTDPANMGAAMAPAAKETIAAFLRFSRTVPDDYDLILTGDLGAVGSELLYALLKKEDGIDLMPVHNDCGLMIFDRAAQDVHAGGSGCGCSASVLCAHILPRMQRGELRRVLFVATGALLSATSTLQKQSIPGIAHAVLFSRDN